MGRITVERARELCELYAFKLDLEHYLVPENRCGCMIALKAAEHFGGVEGMTEAGLDGYSLDDYEEIGNIIGEPKAYVIGLESGFQGWVENENNESSYGTPDYWRGYMEGSDIGISADNGELPLVSTVEGWGRGPEERQEDRHRMRREALRQTRYRMYQEMLGKSAFEGGATSS